jgi:cytidylate kinase
MMRRFLERSAAAGVADPTMGAGSLDVLLGRSYAEAASTEGLADVSDERYLETLCGVVRDLARQDDVVIIGRGGQAILREWTGACHVLLVAALDRRVEFIAQRDGVEPDEAAKRVHSGAKGRADFHHKFFKIDVDDPAHYHVAINTGTYSLGQAAALIADAAQRAGAATGSA